MSWAKPSNNTHHSNINAFWPARYFQRQLATKEPITESGHADIKQKNATLGMKMNGVGRRWKATPCQKKCHCSGELHHSTAEGILLCSHLRNFTVIPRSKRSATSWSMGFLASYLLCLVLWSHRCMSLTQAWPWTAAEDSAEPYIVGSVWST